MAYAVLADLRGPAGYLDQFTTSGGVADTSKDTILQAILNRAEAYVNTYLGVTTSIATAASATRTLYGDGTLYLTPDLPLTAVTGITAPTGVTVPDYILHEGILRVVDSDGNIIYPHYPALGDYQTWSATSSGWLRGVPYAVTGTFGFSAADLAVCAEATLQTAVQLWRYRDSGGSETIGADNAITTVRAGWTPLVSEGLDAIRRRILFNSIGVY